jgi:hypothetical protein
MTSLITLNKKELGALSAQPERKSVGNKFQGPPLRLVPNAIVGQIEQALLLFHPK